MPKQDTNTFEYAGQDLEAMTLAENYYKWILNVIKPYIGKYVVEVGAGVGSFSKLVMETGPNEIVLIEPSKKMHSLLNGNIKSTKLTKVTTHNDYLAAVKTKLKKHAPDTFIYINVFEHIKNDEAELRHIVEALEPGGHVIIFVPALKALYSNFDKSIGHFRRYNKKDLRQLCDGAGLEVERVRYMDMPGILPWWLSFVLMRRTSLVPFLVKTYDNFCVPVIRVFESIIRVPVGKNLLIIAKKK